MLTDLGPRLDSLAVVVAGPWLEDGCLFDTVVQAEIVAGVIFSHQDRTLLNLLQMLPQHLEETACQPMYPRCMFDLFFDGLVIDLFVEQTNLNYERKRAAEPNKHRSSW